MSLTYNFCAGPAMLPTEVMKKAQKEFINWNETGRKLFLIRRFSDMADTSHTP